MKNQKITTYLCLVLFSLILIITSAKLFSYIINDYSKGGLFSLTKIVSVALAATKQTDVYSAKFVSVSPAQPIKITAGQEITVQLKFKNTGKGLSIELPDLPEDLRQQPAWVLKIGR